MVNMALKSSILRSFIFASYLFHSVSSVVGETFVAENPKAEPSLQYCSFFNNRAPQAQPGLKNCSWFKDNSCCQQQEIEATFGVVKPLKGASVQCQRFINYLMCYICAPNQNTFYQKERLTVCDNFCQSFYEACLGASLKGNRIVELYPNGTEFCISRRFLVGSSNCFSFDVALDTKTSAGRSTKDPSLALILASLLLFYYLLTTLIKSTFWENLRSHITTLTGEVNAERKIGLGYNRAMCKQFGGERWMVLLFAASIGMVGSVAADGGEPIEVISGDDVRQWASALSRDLSVLAEDGLAFSAVQKLYQEMPYKTARVSRADELKKLKESLENYFGDRKRLAQDTAHRAAQVYDKLASEEGEVWIRGDDLDYKSVDDLPHSVYLAANRLYSYKLNESREYSSLLQQKVIWGQSVVKLPDSVDRKKKVVIQTVDWSSHLDEIFKQNKRNYPELRWQYFGSNTGVFRLYPGVEWKRNFVGFPEDFEPRIQPWYVDLKSGARNIVIIIDTSTQMQKKGLSRGKVVASVLIGSLNQNHNVAVLESSSAAWDTDGHNRSGGVNVLGCRQAGLSPATSHHKEDLVMAVQQLTARGGSDHLPAFRKAFDLLRLGQMEDPAGKDCGSIVVFITGGKLDDEDIRCTPGFHKYAENNQKSFHAGDYCKYDSDMLLKAISLLQYSLPGSQANIFTFVTSVERKVDLRLPGQMACENNGVMSKILADDDESSFFDQMKAYFHYVETTKTLSDPVLTDVYVSPIDDAATFTVSSSVVSNVTKTRIGIMGIDVALSEVEDLLSSSSFSGDGDVFMVNLADGTAIVHPLAKHSYEIEDFLSHVFLSELETEKGVPEEFAVVLSEMMAGKTGNYTITNNAKAAFLHKGNLIWRRVKSVQYFFTRIADTQFGIGVKYYSLNEEEKIEDVEDPVGTSYYHSIVSSKSDELKEIREELGVGASNSKYYQGVNISTQHSVVAFGPEAFCNTSVYHEQFGSTIPQIQEALNSGLSNTDPCAVQTVARRDAVVTLAMESVWQSRNSTSLANVASTYIATPSGMIRVYPGVTVPKPELLVMNKEPWYTRAVVNRGVLTISAPRRARHVNDVVVTFSRAILNGSNCDASLTFCDSLKVHGVGGIDVVVEEFRELVLSSLTNESNHLERSCGRYSRHYPCYTNRNQMCQTQCYLINEVGEVIYGLPWRRNLLLTDLHGYVFKVLQHNRIFMPKRRVGYQATCLDTGEVVNAQKDASNFRHLFEMRRSCVEETLFYEADRERLEKNFSGVFSRSLDDDPCHSGIFFLSPVVNTDLLLLVFDDFQDLSENATNRVCRKFKRESQTMTKRIERRPCHENVTLGATPFIDQCNRARTFIAPCGYSTAALAAFHSFVFLFLCFLLTLVFLI